MSSKLIKFLSLTLVPESTSSLLTPESCHICKRPGLAHCSLCGKGTCLLHSVRRSIGTLKRAIICEQCDNHSTKISLRRRLESAVKGLGESVQCARAEGRMLKEQVLNLGEELREKEEVMRRRAKSLEERNNELEERLKQAAEARDLVQSRVSSLQASVSLGQNSESLNDHSSTLLEAEFESVSSALQAELVRRSDLSLLLQEYQSQLRHSVPPAVIQVKCCSRCKSVTQFAFKKQHFDLFPSRLEIHDSPIQTCPQTTERETRSCALF